jgi:hypothetical protein
LECRLIVDTSFGFVVKGRIHSPVCVLACLQRQYADSVDPFFALTGGPYQKESFDGSKMVYFGVV